MAATTKTDYWNDSCGIADLTYAIERGATGATSNPTIVGEVLAKERPLWSERLVEIVAEHPTSTESEITWKLIEQMAVKGADLLLPVFEREQGRKGRLSIQTDPTLYRSSERIIAQALAFNELAPNMQIKIPVTHAGVEAIEVVTAAGISINATVCFTVSQSLAVAAAVERGLDRFAATGGDPSTLTPVCTLMVGRLDDWIRVLEARDRIVTDPAYANWAGIACFKHAYASFRERGYRTRMLAAAYRHHLHWSELIGGDIVLTIPPAWQRLFNASDIEVRSRIDEPVPAAIFEDLYRRFPDFRRAYDIDGMQSEEFDSFGASVRTLRGFISSYRDLIAVVRDVMLRNPDVASG